MLSVRRKKVYPNLLKNLVCENEICSFRFKILFLYAFNLIIFHYLIKAMLVFYLFFCFMIVISPQGFFRRDWMQLSYVTKRYVLVVSTRRNTRRFFPSPTYVSRGFWWDVCWGRFLLCNTHVSWSSFFFASNEFRSPISFNSHRVLLWFNQFLRRDVQY